MITNKSISRPVLCRPAIVKQVTGIFGRNFLYFTNMSMVTKICNCMFVTLNRSWWISLYEFRIFRKFLHKNMYVHKNTTIAVLSMYTNFIQWEIKWYDLFRIKLSTDIDGLFCSGVSANSIKTMKKSNKWAVDRDWTGDLLLTMFGIMGLLYK